MKLNGCLESFGENEYDSHISDFLDLVTRKRIIISSKNGKICIFDYGFHLINTLTQEDSCLCLGFLEENNILLSQYSHIIKN